MELQKLSTLAQDNVISYFYFKVFSKSTMFEFFLNIFIQFAEFIELIYFLPEMIECFPIHLLKLKWEDRLDLYLHTVHNKETWHY